MSSSHDKSLRLWERTREPLILEDEREMVRTLGLVTGRLVGCLMCCPNQSVLSGAVTPQ